jgi:hypothetical protein
VPIDLGALADQLDAEALRNGATREVLTNPAKALADRMAGRQVVLAGDGAATLALARHGAAVLLRVAGQPVAGVGLADVAVAMRSGMTAGFADPVDALFHDEEIDGPRPGRPRVIGLALAAERALLAARMAGFDDVELISVDDTGELISADDTGEAGSPATGAVIEELATLAQRLEMAAVYLRLAGG